MRIEDKYVLLFGDAVGNWSEAATEVDELEVAEAVSHNRAFIIVGDNPEFVPA